MYIIYQAPSHRGIIFHRLVSLTCPLLLLKLFLFPKMVQKSSARRNPSSSLDCVVIHIKKKKDTIMLSIPNQVDTWEILIFIYVGCSIIIHIQANALLVSGLFFFFFFLQDGTQIHCVVRYYFERVRACLDRQVDYTYPVTNKE